MSEVVYANYLGYFTTMTNREQSRLYELIGAEIRRLRSGASLSQADLGAEAGLSRSSIVNIEKGRQHAPLHVIWRLADALQVDPADLIPGREEIQPSEEIDSELEAEIVRAFSDEDAPPDEEAVRQVAEFIQTS